MPHVLQVPTYGLFKYLHMGCSSTYIWAVQVPTYMYIGTYTAHTCTILYMYGLYMTTTKIGEKLLDFIEVIFS